MDKYLTLINKYNLFDEKVIKQIEGVVKDSNEGGIMYDGGMHRSEKLLPDIIYNFNLLQQELLKKDYNFFIESGFRGYYDQIKLWFSRTIKESIKRYGFPPFNLVSDKTERLIAHLCIDQYPIWYKENPLDKVDGILLIIGRSGSHELEKIKKDVEFTVAPPGASEHHLGFAFDIGLIDKNGNNCDLTEKKYMQAALDFMSIAPDYGFILRFPEGKSLFTGFKNEIWHYRYVGSPEIAHEIMDNGLTLEEYHIAHYIMNNESFYEQYLNGNLDLDFLNQFVGEEATTLIKRDPTLLDGVRNYMCTKMNGKKR